METFAPSAVTVTPSAPIVPAEERPQLGDTFKIRMHHDEMRLRDLYARIMNCDVIHLDVYNPADPAVCYVVGDADRWSLLLEGSLRSGADLITLKATWLNQQFSGLMKVEIRLNISGFDTPGCREGELEFVG